MMIPGIILTIIGTAFLLGGDDRPVIAGGFVVLICGLYGIITGWDQFARQGAHASRSHQSGKKGSR